MKVFSEPRRVSIVGGVFLALTISFIVASLMTPATLEPVESADVACSDLYDDVQLRGECIEDRLAHSPGFPPTPTWPFLLGASVLMILYWPVVTLLHRLRKRMIDEPS